MGKGEAERLDKKYRVHVHSKRKRLADADGTSVKAVIDALVIGGIFPDDQPRYIQEVSQSQEKISSNEQEETIITITQV